MAKPVILWENELEWASEISCLTSEPDYPVENLKDWREYLIWKSNSASTHTIDITLNTHYFTALEKIRAFALYNYSHSGASTPVALEVRYSSNQVDWTEWFFDENDLVSGEPYILILQGKAKGWIPFIHLPCQFRRSVCKGWNYS